MIKFTLTLVFQDPPVIPCKVRELPQKNLLEEVLVGPNSHRSSRLVFGRLGLDESAAHDKGDPHSLPPKSGLALLLGHVSALKFASWRNIWVLGLYTRTVFVGLAKAPENINALEDDWCPSAAINQFPEANLPLVFRVRVHLKNSLMIILTLKILTGCCLS